MKNIIIEEKNYQTLVIYFTRYDCGKSIKMSALSRINSKNYRAQRKKVFDD